MRLARAGIGVAIAGGIALFVHAMLLARPARQQSERDLYEMLLAREARLRSDCAAWDAAVGTIEEEEPRYLSDWTARETERWFVTNALESPDAYTLWQARRSLARYPEFLGLLVPALGDPTFVGLRDSEDITVEGRAMPLHDHGRMIREDLFTRAGRASWLLKQATGHTAPVVGVHTDPRLLADISNAWRRWFESIDLGRACAAIRDR